MRPGLGAALVPAINTTSWEHGLSCRVVLYRDWGWEDEAGDVVSDVRFAQVIKAEGSYNVEDRTKVVGYTLTAVCVFHYECKTVCHLCASRHESNRDSPSFFISKANSPQNGLRSLDLPSVRGIEPLSNTLVHPPIVTRPQKRKFAVTGLEIPDSDGEDDEDYGVSRHVSSF